MAEAGEPLGPDAPIVIAGAGSVGCFIGGRLALGGRNVTFLARRHIADELHAHGLHLTDFSDLDERIPAARLTVATNPEALTSAALILVTVKSGATEAIAREIAAHRGGRAPVVLSLQNGVDNLATLRAVLGDAAVLGGMVGFNVVHKGGGRFHRGTSGDLVIEAGRDDVLTLLSVPGLSVKPTPDIVGVQWGKLLVNLSNALNALSGRPLREQLQDREWRRLLADELDEALRVLDAAGIRPVPAFPAPNRVVSVALRLPNALFQIAAAPMLKMDPEARASMWADLMRHRPTEIDYLQGAILRLAARHHVSAPLTERIVALVKRAEAADAGPPGLTPAEIRDVPSR